MWKLEHHDRPIQSLTADDNLCLSTVIKAEEVGGDIPQRISQFPFQKKSLIMAAEDIPADTAGNEPFYYEITLFNTTEDNFRSININCRNDI